MFSHHDIVLAYQYDGGVAKAFMSDWVNFFLSVVFSNDYNCSTFQIKRVIYESYSRRLEPPTNTVKHSDVKTRQWVSIDTGDTQSWSDLSS